MDEKEDVGVTAPSPGPERHLETERVSRAWAG